MSENTGLAAVADSGADVENWDGPDQGSLVEDYTAIVFTGIKYDSVDADAKIGDELEFNVRTRVIAVGDEEFPKGSGHIRHVIKVASESVHWKDGTEE